MDRRDGEGADNDYQIAIALADRVSFVEMRLFSPSRLSADASASGP